MGYELSRLSKVMARLLPKQSSSGAGSVQMDKVGGMVSVVNHYYNYSTQPPHSQFNAQDTTESQQEVLELLLTLPKPVRHHVHSFMQREFGTTAVVDLPPEHVNGLRLYVLGVRFGGDL